MEQDGSSVASKVVRWRIVARRPSVRKSEKPMIANHLVWLHHPGDVGFQPEIPPSSNKHRAWTESGKFPFIWIFRNYRISLARVNLGKFFQWLVRLKLRSADYALLTQKREGS